jgi:hypothetical protein
MRQRLDRVPALLLSAALAGCAGNVEPPDPGPQAPPEAASSTASSAPEPSGAVPAVAASSVPPEAAPAAALADVDRPDPAAAAREAGLDAAGGVAALTWRDRAGANTVVLRELQPDPEGDKELFADHVAVSDAGVRTVLREVRDAERDCEYDLTAEFVDDALDVRDDDRDGYGEVLLAYRLACRSDVTPSDLKLLLLEHGDKHILRGSSTNQVVDEPSEPTPEPAPDDWPEGSHDAASRAFDRVQQEF